MKRKRSVILAVLLLVLSLPVSVGAAPASNGVTLETEHFREFDITLPEALAEKYRWEETGFEGTNVLNFYDRGLYDATDETAISAQTRGYRFSISQPYLISLRITRKNLSYEQQTLSMMKKRPLSFSTLPIMHWTSITRHILLIRHN